MLRLPVLLVLLFVVYNLGSPSANRAEKDLEVLENRSMAVNNIAKIKPLTDGPTDESLDTVGKTTKNPTRNRIYKGAVSQNTTYLFQTPRIDV